MLGLEIDSHSLWRGLFFPRNRFSCNVLYSLGGHVSCQ